MMNNLIALRLRPEFVELHVNEIGFDAIDAPDILCAGGMRDFKSDMLPRSPFPAPSVFYRPEQ